MTLRLSFTTRAVSRAHWKILWRQLLIVNRETSMAIADAGIFGTGYLRTGPDEPDFIRRVHPANVAIPMLETRR